MISTFKLETSKAAKQQSKWPILLGGRLREGPIILHFKKFVFGVGFEIYIEGR